MNCKPGDLAVVIRSTSGNEGKFVRVMRLSKWDGLSNPDRSVSYGVVWEIDPPMPTYAGVPSGFALDSNLRPIRDNDKDDETLTWAGKPAPLQMPLKVYLFTSKG